MPTDTDGSDEDSGGGAGGVAGRLASRLAGRGGCVRGGWLRSLPPVAAMLPPPPAAAESAPDSVEGAAGVDIGGGEESQVPSLPAAAESTDDLAVVDAGLTAPDVLGDGAGGQGHAMGSNGGVEAQEGRPLRARSHARTNPRCHVTLP